MREYICSNTLPILILGNITQLVWWLTNIRDASIHLHYCPSSDAQTLSSCCEYTLQLKIGFIYFLYTGQSQLFGPSQPFVARDVGCWWDVDIWLTLTLKHVSGRGLTSTQTFLCVWRAPRCVSIADLFLVANVIETLTFTCLQLSYSCTERCCKCLKTWTLKGWVSGKNFKKILASSFHFFPFLYDVILSEWWHLSFRRILQWILAP